MNFLRLHWFDVGLALAAAVGAYLLLTDLEPLNLLLWLSLISLFLHQFEEYRYPGYFPGMMNSVLFSSQQPDRYPLNTQSALIVNVGVAWSSYLLAALFAETVLWLAIATTLVSASNFVAHAVIFNARGKTLYNPGMITGVLMFLPISVYFFVLVLRGNLAHLLDWVLGVVLGLAFSYIGVFKIVGWLKDKNTEYAFPARCLPPDIRKAS